MSLYKTKTKKLAGTNYQEVRKKAFLFYQQIQSNTKRRSYVRSVYFNKQKIFLPLFWSHLREKLNHRDKTRRAQLFPCAIELIRNSMFDPVSKQSLEKFNILLHRFAGKTKDGQLFFVQIKEDKRSGEKWLISVFPKK